MQIKNTLTLTHVKIPSDWMRYGSRFHYQPLTVGVLIIITKVTAGKKEDFEKLLTNVQFKLQTSSFPDYVMLPKGAKKDGL